VRIFPLFSWFVLAAVVGKCCIVDALRESSRVVVVCVRGSDAPYPQCAFVFPLVAATFSGVANHVHKLGMKMVSR